MAAWAEWLLTPADDAIAAAARQRKWALRALVLGLLGLPQAVCQLLLENDFGKLEALPGTLAGVAQCLSVAVVLIGLVYLGLLRFYPSPSLTLPTLWLGWAASLCVLFVGGCLSLQPLLQHLRDSAGQMEESNNLKQIGLAAHNYHDQNRKMPPWAIGETPEGEPALSWRVAFIPYIEASNLYSQFRMDEAWDSEHNLPLLTPNWIYHSSIDPDDTTDTHYRVFTGPDTLFPDGPRKRRDPRNGVRLDQIPDGASNTVLVVEASEGVPWTKPQELPYAPNAPLPPLGYSNRRTFLVLMADGTVRTLRRDVSPEVMHRLINCRDEAQPE